MKRICICLIVFIWSLTSTGFVVASTQKDKEPFFDSRQGLIWQSGDFKEMQWLEGVHYCNSLELAGYSSWRSPLKEELVELAQLMDEKSTGAQQPLSGHEDFFWSLSLSGQGSQRAWAVDMQSGVVELLDLTSENVKVRCLVETIEAVYLPLLKRWANAWSNQNVDEYLACYGSSFDPPKGMARHDWEQLRRKRIKGPEFISINLSDVKVLSETENLTEIMFLQEYTANHYRDQVVKVLTIGVENGDLVILSEQSVADVK